MLSLEEVKLSDFPKTQHYDKSPLDRSNPSTRLNYVKDKIMRVWELRVRESVASAPDKSTLVLRSHLPELLENLVFSISPGSSNADIDEARKIGKDHGDQRATLLDYTFSQVLHESRILRKVIFEVLEEEKLQTSDVRDTILDVLDEGIERTIEQFSFVRTEELKRSNRDLEHFAAIAAHDLKSPLATIVGFAELLEESDGKIGVEETEYIRAIKRSSARMTLLIDRLLEYSSVGREVKAFEPVSTDYVVKSVVENLKRLIDRSNVKLNLGKLPIVFGDVSLLSQLFQNLISNALRFRDSSRNLEISVEAKDEGKTYLFSIKDNGIGFDPENKENIFSLFKRLENQKANAGSGIGLATAKKVVEIHGGRIWADSKPGVGSTFYFTLPKSVSDAIARH